MINCKIHLWTMHFYFTLFNHYNMLMSKPYFGKFPYKNYFKIANKTFCDISG